MKKIFFTTTIVLVVFLFVPFKSFAAVVINEVLYDPDGVDTGKEYIILYNNGDTSYSLSSHCLYASGKHYVFGSFTLNAKEKAIIHWNADGTNTSIDLYTGKSGWSNMGNSSGSIALFLNHEPHNSSNIRDFIQYVKKETWESAAVSAGIWTTDISIPNVSATGKAIKLKTDGVDNNSPNDWIEAEPSIIQEEPEELTTEKPETPLIPIGNNPPIADAGDNIIGFIGQEIIFDGSKSSDPDNDELSFSWNTGDGHSLDKMSFNYKYLYPGTYLVTLMVYDGRNYVSDTITIKIQSQQITINEFLPNPSGKDEEEEWIEIYNDSDSIVDISGWQLDDMDGGSKPFVFPQNTLIAPKSYLVFSRQITKIALNNDKDSVRLLLPEGVVFQEITYEKPPLGKSSARTDKGFVWNIPTPGAPNISGIAVSESKNITYQYQIKPETTKESTQDYSILYQNKPEAKIEGGYTTISINEEQKEIAQQEQSPNQQSQLAMIKEGFSKQSQTNLIFIILAIVAGGLIIGLILTKFLKKSP